MAESRKQQQHQEEIPPHRYLQSERLQNPDPDAYSDTQIPRNLCYKDSWNMERKRLKKEIGKLLRDYVGIRLRENAFDPRGQRQSTFLDDMVHYNLAFSVALLWLSDLDAQIALTREEMNFENCNRYMYPNRIKREAMILSSYAGILMNSIPIEEIFEIYRMRPLATHWQNSANYHWNQPFKLSLHPFSMLTAPEAAEYTWKQSEHISPQLSQGQRRVTWDSCTWPSRATKSQPAELQQLHTEKIFETLCSKNERNFRSIREFEAETPYLQPYIATDPMQQVCKPGWWHPVSRRYHKALYPSHGIKYQAAAHGKSNCHQARRAKKNSKQLDSVTRGKQQIDKGATEAKQDISPEKSETDSKARTAKEAKTQQRT